MASNKFEFISGNAIKLLSPLINNQTILRYLYYLDHNPLSPNKQDIDNEFVIDDGIHIDEARIYLDLFNDTISTSEKISIFFSPYGSATNYNERTVLSSFNFALDIVIPSSYWAIKGKGKFRAYEIANEICKEIDKKSIAGIGEVTVQDGRVGVSGNYRILPLLIKVQNAVFANG